MDARIEQKFKHLFYVFSSLQIYHGRISSSAGTLGDAETTHGDLAGDFTGEDHTGVLSKGGNDASSLEVAKERKNSAGRSSGR